MSAAVGPAVKWLLALSILSYLVLYYRMRHQLSTLDVKQQPLTTTRTTTVDVDIIMASPAPVTGNNGDAGGPRSPRNVASSIDAAARDGGSLQPTLAQEQRPLRRAVTPAMLAAMHSMHSKHHLAGLPPPYTTTTSELKRRQCIQEALRKALAFHQHPLLMNRKGCKRLSVGFVQPQPRPIAAPIPSRLAGATEMRSLLYAQLCHYACP